MEQMSISEFLNQSPKAPVIDVRSPGEYEKGHIPGAVNIPLFTDSERADVGITYKHQGKSTALKDGLKIAGPKLASLIEELEKHVNGEGAVVKVHCWRGGMRSSSVAWLFETMGYQCYILKDGYKSYRNLMETLFDKFDIVLIGGETGSGKTKILHELKKQGEQVVDLEKLANHKGSAFGAIGEDIQPSNEHFQNLVIDAFLNCNVLNPLFVEDESSFIGKVTLPERLWQKMKNSPIMRLSLPVELRIENLVEDYGKYKKSELEICIHKITKKLGGVNTELSIKRLYDNDLEGVARMMLNYYDKSYRSLLEKNKKNIFHTLEIADNNPSIIAKKIAAVLKTVSINV